MSKPASGAQGGGDKPVEKKEEHHSPKPSSGASGGGKGKHTGPAPGGCHAWGCKASEKRFNFCEEHYEHFKFGLIKKSGEPVSDYEKKFEHYQAYVARSKKGAHKVA